MSEADERAGDGTVALELSDGGILACSAEGPLAAPSPGFAVVDGHEVRTGSAARARARLTPRRAHHRFWHELDETPLPRPFPRRWTHLDLAHRQLADLRAELSIEPRRVIAVVPGDRGHDELARIVGIAVAAGWPIAGLIDAAVAVASSLEVDAEVAWHVDVGLHRTVATELALKPGIRRRRVVVADVGRVVLERTWARLFARRLVSATRYDPLHSAASEQALYEALDGWLERLGAADRVLASVEAARRTHEVEVSRLEIEAAAADAWGRIAAVLPGDGEGGSRCLLLSARAAVLPGLATALEPIAGPATELAAEAPARGALALRDLVLGDEGDPSFVVRLPAGNRGAA